MTATAYLVIPDAQGDKPCEVFLYVASSPRQAVIEHGRPGRFAVVEALVFEAGLDADQVNA